MWMLMRHLLVPTLAITSWRHTVCGLSVCLPVCPCIRSRTLKLCKRHISQTTRGNFTKFTTKVQLGTKMNWLDFEVKRSRLRSLQDQIRSEGHFGNFEGHRFKGHGRSVSRHTCRRFTIKDQVFFWVVWWNGNVVLTVPFFRLWLEALILCVFGWFS